MVDEVDHLTYLGSNVSTSGDGQEEILVRPDFKGKPGLCLASKHLEIQEHQSEDSEVRFFKSNVLSTLLYGAESWKMTKTISHKLEVFQNKCLYRSLRIYWPQTISNSEFGRRTRTLRTNHSKSPAKEVEMD